MKWKSTILSVATAVTCLLVAAPALAAVSETNVHVTSPSGFYLIADEVTPADTMTLTGTSNGIAGEKLDINCYAGNRVLALAKEVTIQSGGTFSFSGLFTRIEATCVLRAVPAKDATPHPPGSPSPFTGPTLAIGERENNTVNKGPNTGKLKAYYIYASQLLGAFDYSSLGDCTIDDSYVYDPVTFASAVLDYCNAWFNSRNGASKPEPGIANPTRSEAPGRWSERVRRRQRTVGRQRRRRTRRLPLADLRRFDRPGDGESRARRDRRGRQVRSRTGRVPTDSELVLELRAHGRSSEDVDRTGPQWARGVGDAALLLDRRPAPCGGHARGQRLPP